MAGEIFLSFLSFFFPLTICLKMELKSPGNSLSGALSDRREPYEGFEWAWIVPRCTSIGTAERMSL
jgi:hypothetical protein